MDTGRKILNLRKDRGVPQKSLANLTAVTPSALSRIESGVHQPRGPVALRLARHLGVTADYLLDDSAPYPPPASEILANLTKPVDGPMDESVQLSTREKRLLQRLRELEEERLILLEAVLEAPRKLVRRVACQLGAAERLPGLDDEERAEYEGSNS